RVKNATVVVYDTEGMQLLEGKTDENGEFSFKVPQQTGLKVVLRTSMGHLAEGTIPAEEITGVADSSASGAPEVSTDAVAEQPASLAEQEQSRPTTVGLTLEEVQGLIDRSLDRKLTPVYNKLAEALDRGPGLRDVIGGIGYIFGLVGVALYFSTRRKGKEK
ncbi:MAG: hypothetical protein JRJ47_12390, partial [Deltaproteobacteria bacterium]|nr:hypothetical protein [Deltaproteobacteria bacterium]